MRNDSKRQPMTAAFFFFLIPISRLRVKVRAVAMVGPVSSCTNTEAIR
jgi:hypothetical protein